MIWKSLNVQIVESSTTMIMMFLMPGQRDVAEALQHAGAVHRRRLVQLGRDGLHAGQERDAEERKAAPDVHGDDRGHGRARLAEPAHALGQDAEDADQQVVQHAETAVEHPQEVQRRDDGGRHPRDRAARPSRTSASGCREVSTSAITTPRHELEADRAEREDEAVDDGALEEAVPGEPDVVLEADEDRRHADQLVGHATGRSRSRTDRRPATGRRARWARRTGSPCGSRARAHA